MVITIVVVREFAPGARQVTQAADAAKKYRIKGAGLLMEHGAPAQASFPDATYHGAQVAVDARGALDRANALRTMQPPLRDEIAALRAGSMTAGDLQAHDNQRRDGVAVAHDARACHERALLAGQYGRLQAGLDRTHDVRPNLVSFDEWRPDD